MFAKRLRDQIWAFGEGVNNLENNALHPVDKQLVKTIVKVQADSTTQHKGKRHEKQGSNLESNLESHRSQQGLAVNFGHCLYD